ncbi:MAG: hypothetical protein R3E08_06300 [Thiotrichaceae bacterium]
MATHHKTRVTIAGFGGQGKTYLATELAAMVVASGGSRAWFL